MRITDHLAHWARANKITKEEIVTRIVAVMSAHKNLLRKERTKALLQKIDDIHNEQDQSQISCRAGCSFCCHQPIRVVQEEMEILMDYIKDNNIQVDLERLELQNRLAPGEYFEYPDEESACVLLGDDGRCRVYEARPASCRNYHVTTPPENCKNKHKTDRDNYPVNIGINGEAQFTACALYNLSEAPTGILAQELYKRLVPKEDDDYEV